MKYDVFLSYKSEDYKIAMKVNQFLTENGLTVFFSEVTLGNIGKSEYSEAIDKAIDASSHMIVVASKIEYLTHGWVHYEWSSFADNLKCGCRSGNLITILTLGLNLHDLPLGLRHRQSFTTKNYEEEVLSYLAPNTNINLASKGSNKANRSTIILTIIATIGILLTGIAGFYLRDYNKAEYPEVQKQEIENILDPAFVSSLAENTKLDVDTSKVASYYNLALMGSSEAQFEIGSYCYALTMYEKALYWFTLSAKQGNAKAANGIGRCYYNGNGTTKSPHNAYNWFRDSAKGGCVEGMNNVGKCLVEGTGVIRPDVEKALVYYKRAADLDYLPAIYNYAVHLFFGKGTNINTVDGLYWLNKAADKGSASAQFTLGNIYREGLGDVPIDLEMAEDWYLKAINNNDEKIAFKAMKKLKLIPGNQMQ